MAWGGLGSWLRERSEGREGPLGHRPRRALTFPSESEQEQPFATGIARAILKMHWD